MVAAVSSGALRAANKNHLQLDSHWNQKRISTKLSALSPVALILFAASSIGGTHDFFADSRALGTSIRIVEDSGVPRKSIQAGLVTLGWTSDGWAPIKDGGYQ